MAKKKVSENISSFDKCRDSKAKIKPNKDMTPEERASQVMKESNYTPTTKELEEEIKKNLMIDEIKAGLAQAGKEEGIDIHPELLKDLQDFAKDLDEGDTWSDELAEEAKEKKSKKHFPHS